MKSDMHTPSPLKTVTRILIIWVIQTLGLLLLTRIIDGVQVETAGDALVAVAVITLLNGFLWPILSYIILPFAVFTLGLASLVLNGILILIASALVTGFVVEDIWAAIWLSVGLTAINIIMSSLLTIDDDSTWYRNVVKRRMKRSAQFTKTDVPGIFFLEIDGLSKPILEKAIREGYVPTLSRWIESGSHQLVGWETDLSSQTSASQAGILHGNNWNIPAFRWYDRKRKTIIASSSPDEVARLEKEISDGNGLLCDNGVSRGNLMSGDAPNVMNTASTIKDLSRLHVTDFQAFFISPYNFSRTVILTIWDMIIEIWQFRRDQRNNVYPILDKKKRGGKYPILRAFTTVVMRELNINTLIGDLFAGASSAYATFVGYDEVAHHSGVESKDALDTLKELDRQFRRIERATKDAPRPYHLVVLSDHGQSGGATFKQRYHVTLEDLVQKMISNFKVVGDVDVHEDWKYLNVFLTEAVKYDNSTMQKTLTALLRKRIDDGSVVLGPEEKLIRQTEVDKTLEKDKKEEKELPAIVVLASGNLGLIYSSRSETRLTEEVLNQLVPGLLENLSQHEGIGFLMVKSMEHGAVVIGSKGRYYLDEDRLEGENPLVDFGPRAADHLRRANQFPDAPDILINSFYNIETNEVAAFEELIGNHGGLGGYQSQPFLLHPADLKIPEEPLVGAASVYKVFKEWLAVKN